MWRMKRGAWRFGDVGRSLRSGNRGGAVTLGVGVHEMRSDGMGPRGREPEEGIEAETIVEDVFFSKISVRHRHI